MKSKLQALIEEQKALTAKFEELLNATTEESSTLDPKKVYIKGHPTRGAEVIKMLEDFGGWNVCDYEGVHSHQGYFITDKGYINSSSLGYFKDHTELHLPEKVSAENAQTTDVKVGDWIWVDEIYDYADDIIGLIKRANPHKIIEGEDVGYLNFEIDGDDYQVSILRDTFHKVDPPKEEVELIEGEVYQGLHYVFIMKSYSDCGSDIRFSILAEYSKNKKGITFNTYTKVRKCDIAPATPEQRKQLLDALEKAGKHFDKENMRLLDVEEWSCEKGLPFIARHNNKDKWKCVIFWEFYNIKDSNERPIALFKSNEYCDYKCAIPYNDQTKHLVGTTDSPDKHYKFV